MHPKRWLTCVALPRRTGNRVTCRDWFQLSLKEGLTVYRCANASMPTGNMPLTRLLTLRVCVLAHGSDQEFSSDMNSRPVKRIEDVRLLRARQFAEDSSPMAHPIRPCSVEKIDNVRTCGHAAPHGVCI